MKNRQPGAQCKVAMPYLRSNRWNKVPFSEKAGGCGGAMVIALIHFLNTILIFFFYFNKASNVYRIIIFQRRTT